MIASVTSDTSQIISDVFLISDTVEETLCVCTPCSNRRAVSSQEMLVGSSVGCFWFDA